VQRRNPGAMRDHPLWELSAPWDSTLVADRGDPQAPDAPIYVNSLQGWSKEQVTEHYGLRAGDGSVPLTLVRENGCDAYGQVGIRELIEAELASGSDVQDWRRQARRCQDAAAKAGLIRRLGGVWAASAAQIRRFVRSWVKEGRARKLRGRHNLIRGVRLDGDS